MPEYFNQSISPTCNLFAIHAAYLAQAMLYIKANALIDNLKETNKGRTDAAVKSEHEHRKT